MKRWNKLRTVVSGFMAVVLTLGLLSVPSLKHEVLAAEGTTAYFSQIENKDSPLKNRVGYNEADNEDTVHLVWNLAKDAYTAENHNFISNDKFILTYHLRDNTEATLQIEKLPSGQIEVTYQYAANGALLDVANSVWVYDRLLGNFTQDAAGINDASVNRIFDNEGAPDQVTFTMNSDNGFYFRDNDAADMRVAFFWDKNSDNFYFATNGATLRGYYYDFNLDVMNKNGDSYYDKPITQYIMTGYSYGESTGFAVTPFAKDDVTPDNGRILDMIANPIPKVGPAEEVGVYVDIAYPKIWDPVKNKFVQVTGERTDPLDLTFMYTLSFVSKNRTAPGGNAEYSYSFRSSADPLTGLSDKASGVNSKGVTISFEQVGEEKLEGGRDAVRIKIGNLEASTIYQELRLQANVTQNTPQKDAHYNWPTTRFANGMATYLAYRIYSEGSEFFIQITPYQYILDRERLGGTYTVYSMGGVSGSQIGDAPQSVWNAYMLEKKVYQEGDTTDLLVSLGATVKLGAEGKWYRIVFDSTVIKNKESQIYHYKPDVSDIRLPTPEILTPIVAKVVPSDNTKNETLILSLDWNMGLQSVLSVLHEKQKVENIVFTFSRGTTPTREAPAANYQDYLMVGLNLKKALNQSKDYDPKNAITVSGSGVTVIASEKDSVYTLNAMVNGEPTPYVYGHLEISLPISAKDDWEESSGIKFVYPYVYFTDVRAEYNKVDNNGDPGMESINPSIPRNITINGMEKTEVTAPQNLRLNEGSVGQNRFQIEWSKVSVAEYEQLMLHPQKLAVYTSSSTSTYFNNSVKFNVYMTKSQDKLIDLTKALETSSQKKNPPAEAIAKYVAQPKDITAILTVSPAAAVPEVDLLKATSLTNWEEETVNGTAIDWLRSNNVLKLSGIPQNELSALQSLVIKGADYNDVYYIVLDAYVEPYAWEKDGADYKVDGSGYPVVDPLAPIVKSAVEYSKFTKAISVTTKADINNPQPEEAVPLAPTNVDKENVTSNAATIYWDRRRLEEEQDSIYKYQVLRVWNKRLTTAQEGMRIPAGDMLDQIDQTSDPFIAQVVGYDQVAVFDTAKDDFALYKKEPAEYQLSSFVDKWKFTDSTLSPNQIYFYYVRTITVNPESTAEVPNAISYSNWIPVSVTTSPVTPPKNLVVEQDLVKDTYTETVISFDAPVTPQQLEDGEAYFGVSVAQDGAEQPERVLNSASDISALVNSAGKAADDGYYKYTYTIKNLKAGQIYTIRVRVYDEKLKEWSAYSVTVRTRTEVNQEEYDNEKDTEKWYNSFKKQLQELLKNPYWKMSKQNGSLTEAYIYRDSMFDAQMQTTVNGAITLAAKHATRQDYYIPATVLQKNNAANKGFVIENAGISVTLTANSISSELTQAVKDAAGNKDLSDYYIKITAYTSERTQELEGNKPLSPQIQLTFGVVGTNTTEKKWDQEMSNTLTSMISNDTLLNNVEATLKTMIEKDATSEELVAYVDKQVQEVENRLIAVISTSFISTTKKTYTISALNKPAIVRSSVNTQATVSAYRYDNGLWSSLPTTAMGNTASFSTNTAGIYIFAGKTISTEALQGSAYSQKIGELIGKYALDDYIGKNLTSTSLHASATGNMVAGVIARLAGAPKTADPYAWLNEKGYRLPQRNATAAVTTQEAVYAAMLLYEMKTGTKVDSIKITNFASTANITGIDASYKKSIQAAYQFGFITDSALQPKANISIIDFLEIIGKMAEKVKL